MFEYLEITVLCRIEENPTAFLTPSQPLMGQLEVKEEDITAQEARVVEARARLAEAMKEVSAVS